MVLRNIVIVSIVVAGSAVSAQTPVAAQLPADAQHQIQIFEVNLRAAVEKAGGDLAKRAIEVVPDIILRFETAIRIRSAVLPNTYLFFVEVPGIEATSAQMWQLSLQMQMQRQNPRMGNPAQPVLPPPPPIDPNGAPRMSNPEKEYSEFTRQSLVDTMLDNAFGLPLKEGQTLTVVVGVADDVPTTAIAATPRKLYLTMKSEDLLALRQGKITRDEARALIKESRY